MIARNGRRPGRESLCTYHDDDALLLLLRVDRELLEDRTGEHFELPIESSFVAMPEMSAEAVSEAAGARSCRAD